MPAAASTDIKRAFLNKRFFLYIRKQADTKRAAELIRVFNGQVEEFFDASVSYVLTDIESKEWPPHGEDELLKRAQSYGVKLMSFSDLVRWCSKYISSQFSSDEDDETTNLINRLQEPYVKFQDIHCKHAPIAKEFKKWPELNLSPSLGKPIFWDLSQSANSSAITSTVTTNQLQQQQQLRPITNSQTLNQSQTATPATPQLQPRGVKRRHPVYCEICNQKSIENLEEHLQSIHHKINTERHDWGDVHSVLVTVPKLSSLGNVSSLTTTTTTIRPTEHQEFFCLHKLDTASQLFVNPTSNKVL